MDNLLYFASTSTLILCDGFRVFCPLDLCMLWSTYGCARHYEKFYFIILYSSDCLWFLTWKWYVKVTLFGGVECVQTGCCSGRMMAASHDSLAFLHSLVSYPTQSRRAACRYGYQNSTSVWRELHYSAWGFSTRGRPNRQYYVLSMIIIFFEN